MAGRLIEPLRSAIELARRGHAIAAWLVALAMSVALWFLQARAYEEDPLFGPGEADLVIFSAGTIVSALIIFFLGRTLLRDASDYGRPLLARFVGIYLMAVLLVVAVQTLGEVAIIALGGFRAPPVLAAAVVTAVASITLFPLFVRCFATAAGIEEPRLGSIWSFVFTGGRAVLFWYVTLTVALEALSTTVLVASRAAAGGEGPSLVPGAIEATSQIMRCLFDIVAVKMTTRGWRDDAEVFA